MSIPPEQREFSSYYMDGVAAACKKMVGEVRVGGITLPSRVIVLFWHDKEELTFVTGAGVRLMDEQTVQVRTGRISFIPPDSSLSQNAFIQDAAASLGVIVCDEKTAQTLLVEESGKKIEDHHYRLRANNGRDIEIYTPKPRLYSDITELPDRDIVEGIFFSEDQK